MLRIIGGKFKGKKLLLPLRHITRPMRDMVKESLFSMIQFKIKNSVILDAFSGSGSLGIEAISRGAIKVIGVENDKTTFNVLKQNIENLKINNFELLQTDALKYFKKSQGVKFDFIFLDPPFKEYELINEILKDIFKNELITSYGYVILHTDNPKKIIIPTNALIQKEKHYGINYLLMISNNL